MDDYQRCVDSRILGPASRSPFCVGNHVPVDNNFKFASAQKTFRHAFHPRMTVTWQSSDWASLKWLRQRYIGYVADFMVAYQQGRSLTRQITETGGGVQSPWGYSYQMLTSTTAEYWASDNTESSTCADCPTQVQALKHHVLHCTDQHVYILVCSPHSTGLADQQYKHRYRYRPIRLRTSDIGIKPGIGRSLNLIISDFI